MSLDLLVIKLNELARCDEALLFSPIRADGCRVFDLLSEPKGYFGKPMTPSNHLKQLLREIEDLVVSTLHVRQPGRWTFSTARPNFRNLEKLSTLGFKVQPSELFPPINWLHCVIDLGRFKYCTRFPSDYIKASSHDRSLA